VSVFKPVVIGVCVGAFATAVGVDPYGMDWWIAVISLCVAIQI